jgi:hypothetical protein
MGSNPGATFTLARSLSTDSIPQMVVDTPVRLIA